MPDPAGREPTACRCDHDHDAGRVPSGCPNCADCQAGRGATGAGCPEHDPHPQRDGSTWCPNCPTDEGRRTTLPFSCCDHCGCGTTWGVWPERTGHDDTCARGCNDHEAVPDES